MRCVASDWQGGDPSQQRNFSLEVSLSSPSQKSHHFANIFLLPIPTCHCGWFSFPSFYSIHSILSMATMIIIHLSDVNHFSVALKEKVFPKSIMFGVMSCIILVHMNVNQVIFYATKFICSSEHSTCIL